MNHPSVIETVHLFPKLDRELSTLLKSLSPKDWELQTLAPKWKVKDVAAHLLDGNIRAVSNLRDDHFGEQADTISSYQELVGFLDRLNGDWVKAMKRMSPQLIITLLEITGEMYCKVIKNLDPQGQALYPVAWAGEESSPNWFHIAREYTEKWHHQQQIRHAVDQTGILFSPDFYYPFLDTSFRALPHHYKNVPAVESTCLEFEVLGKGGGTWYLIREMEQWVLAYSCSGRPSCKIQIDGEIAWRIFTKGISKGEAEKRSNIDGVKELGVSIFDMLAVMA